MKKLIYIISLLLIAVGVYATEITGKVVDFGTKQAIDFANVSVMKSAGNNQPAELITGTVTDEKGNFTIDSNAKRSLSRANRSMWDAFPSKRTRRFCRMSKS